MFKCIWIHVTAVIQFLISVFLCASHPVIQYVWVWRSLHLDNGVEDVMYVVSEMQDWVGDDGFGGGDAGRQQGQSGGEGEW